VIATTLTSTGTITKTQNTYTEREAWRCCAFRLRKYEVGPQMRENLDFVSYNIT